MSAGSISAAATGFISVRMGNASSSCSAAAARSVQQKDIELAHARWEDYKRRK